MKMLVSDYDNTFSVDIKNNINSVQNFMKNNIFVIATGRSFVDFKKVEEKYNIKYNYLIIDHGATIVYDDKIIYTKCIDNDVLKILINLLNNNIVFLCSGLKKINILENVTKINVHYDDIETSKKMNDFLNTNYKDYINSYLINPYTIEITSNLVSKKIAIDYLNDVLNVDSIYTIGDSYSDIDMIKTYNGFTMKDCVDELNKVKKVSSVSEVINLIENDF